MTKWHTVWTSASGTVRIQQWDDREEFAVQTLIGANRWWPVSTYKSLEAAQEAALKMEARNA